MDTIILAGIRALCAHGVLPEEQGRPQPFEVDVELSVDLAPAGRSEAGRSLVFVQPSEDGGNPAAGGYTVSSASNTRAASSGWFVSASCKRLFG